MPLELFTVGEPIADTKAPPDVPVPQMWEERKFRARLVNPANRRRLSVIVVGTGLAGGSAAATLAEAGYRVKNFWFQDSPGARTASPRRAGSTPRRTTATTATACTGCSTTRSRAATSAPGRANSYRLAEVSATSSTRRVAQGVPFAREYGGLLDNRSFGGAQVSRTFYARGQTGQQLLLRRLPGAGAADRPRQRRDARPHRDARPDRRRRPGPRHRRPRPDHRRDQHPPGRRRGAGLRRVQQRLLPVHQRQGLQRHGDLAGAQAGRAASPTPATPRSTRPASRSAATTSRS